MDGWMGGWGHPAKRAFLSLDYEVEKLCLYFRLK